MRGRLFAAAIVVAVGLGAFALGRVSRPARPDRAGYQAGFRAGRDAAFCCYDGGWGYGEPYIVVLRRGGAGVTYRIAQRWPLLPGLEYRACGRRICAGAGERAEHVIP